MKLPPQEHFLRMAWMVALNLSKDPHTKVGSIITTPDYRQISMGYNGFPRGLVENSRRWSSDIKENYSVHSEANNLIQCPFNTVGCYIFSTVEPCHKCCGLLLNAGISRVYFSERYKKGKRHLIDEYYPLFEVFEQWKVNPEFLKNLKSCY